MQLHKGPSRGESVSQLAFVDVQTAALGHALQRLEALDLRLVALVVQLGDQAFLVISGFLTVGALTSGWRFTVFVCLAVSLASWTCAALLMHLLDPRSQVLLELGHLAGRRSGWA